MACCFAFPLSDKTAAGRHSSLPATLASSLVLPPLPDPFSFYFRSVPSFTLMIISDSDSASPSSNSRQADQSATGHDQAREGPRVRLDENIMALCHCQIIDRGFTDATDMVGPSIEVLRPTSTQTALDAPSGFFTVHLASLKKGLRFPLHSLLIEFLNEVDLLPCQLVPNSHRYIAGYLIRCKKVGVKPTLDHFLFTFKLTKVEPQGLEEEMDGDLLIGHFIAGRKRKRDATRQSKSRRSSSRGEDSPLREQVVIEVEDQDDAALETGTMAISSPPRSLMLGGDLDRARISAGSEDDLNNMVLLKLSQATLGMIELVGQRQDRQAAMDEAKKAAEDKQKELQDEVARLARELEEEKGRSANLETKNASLSSEAHRLEEAIESFKSSPEFTAVAMERMGKLVVEWLNTRPGAQWMVKESEKTFSCGLFRAQLVFRDKLARLPKGISLPDLGLPPPCRAFAEFDPSPYLDEESSSAFDEEEETAAQGNQDGQGDQGPGTNLAASKAGGGTSLGI
ncbi:unnamed protein product [Cuscuta campestris]|uniref:Transposase (putative) gypsy type domain-containing protein n=1 Tax=Cuscuta campestris TaxID=132261 RepID=A0A484KU84_9ASTE|nr:unnamed protein product [Cuscuta campestris]